MLQRKEARTQAHIDKTRDIKRVVHSYLRERRHIFSIEQIQQDLELQSGLKFSRAAVSRILREQFSMRYRKIKPTSFLGNKERNLALRCLYAQKFLQVLNEGYTIINCDQTWLNQTDFRRHKWCIKGKPNSLPIKNVAPRVSVIAALSTTG